MLTDDWFAVVERGASFPDGHFDRLLFEDDNWKDPIALVKHLPGGLKYADRVKDLTQSMTLRGSYFVTPAEKRLTQEQALPLVEGYRQLLVDVGKLKNRDALIEQIRRAPVRFEPSYDAFDALLTSGVEWNGLPDRLDDYYISKLWRKNSNLHLLDEATLSLTMSKEATMWVMEPLVETGLELRPGYDLAVGGGLVATPATEIVCHIEAF